MFTPPWFIFHWSTAKNLGKTSVLFEDVREEQNNSTSTSNFEQNTNVSFLVLDNNSSYGRPLGSRVSLQNTGPSLVCWELGLGLSCRSCSLEKMGIEMVEDLILAREVPSQTVSQHKSRKVSGLGLKGHTEMYCSLYRFNERAINTMETDSSRAGHWGEGRVTWQSRNRVGRRLENFPFQSPAGHC